MKKTDKVKSPIDSMIIDLIMEHYNIQSLEGKRESLSGDEFMNLVVLAESQYYENVLEENVTDTNVGMA